MFDVGNIVWYIGGSTPRVLLLKVVEEITKKTLTGEEKNYVLVFNSASGEKRVSKSKLADQGKFYPDEKSAKASMVESASKAIDHMLLTARNNAGDLFDTTTQPSPEPVQEEAFDGMKITLEDGTVATIKGGV